MVELDGVLFVYLRDETIRRDSAIDRVFFAADIGIRLESVILGCRFSVAVVEVEKAEYMLVLFLDPFVNPLAINSSDELKKLRGYKE